MKTTYVVGQSILLPAVVTGVDANGRVTSVAVKGAEVKITLTSAHKEGAPHKFGDPQSTTSILDFTGGGGSGDNSGDGSTDVTLDQSTS